MADQVIAYLHEQWLQLASELTDQILAESYFTALIAAYSQTHRVYHRLDHLQHLIGLLNAVKVEDSAVLWASFYHDYVYEPGQSNNESKSAKIAEQQLKRLGIASEVRARVATLILATKGHRFDTNDYEAAAFLDADMAILGEDREVYATYVNAIKQEFSRIPEFLYKRGRKSFLQQLLVEKRIFITDWFYEHFEKKARENIEWELNQVNL